MKTILVGLDGSEREKGVLEVAASLARRTGSGLVLFRAVGLPHDLPSALVADTVRGEDLVKILDARAREALATLATSVPQSVPHRLCTRVGTPWQAILRAAVDENADLIVIGSHGYDLLDRVLGTTAAKVVQHADRGVLVVRAPGRLLEEP